MTPERELTILGFGPVRELHLRCVGHGGDMTRELARLYCRAVALDVTGHWPRDSWEACDNLVQMFIEEAPEVLAEELALAQKALGPNWADL